MEVQDNLYSFKVTDVSATIEVLFVGMATGVRKLARLAGLEKVEVWSGFESADDLTQVDIENVSSGEGIDSSFVIAMFGGTSANVWYIEAPDRTLGIFEPASGRIMYWHKVGNTDALKQMISTVMGRVVEFTSTSGNGFSKFAYEQVCGLNGVVNPPLRPGVSVLMAMHSQLYCPELQPGNFVYSPPRIFLTSVLSLERSQHLTEVVNVYFRAVKGSGAVRIRILGDSDYLEGNMRNGRLDILLYTPAEGR